MQRLKPEPGEARVLFEIEDASASNIRPMSMYATEDEILFKSGVKFEVVDQKNFLMEVTPLDSGRESRMQLCPSL